MPAVACPLRLLPRRAGSACGVTAFGGQVGDGLSCFSGVFLLCFKPAVAALPCRYTANALCMGGRYGGTAMTWDWRWLSVLGLLWRACKRASMTCSGKDDGVGDACAHLLIVPRRLCARLIPFACHAWAQHCGWFPCFTFCRPTLRTTGAQTGLYAGCSMTAVPPPRLVLGRSSWFMVG